MQTAYTCYCPVLPTGCRLQAALSSTETRRGIKKCHFHPLKLLQLVSILKFRKNSRTHHRAPEGLGAPSPFVSVRAQSPALAHFLHFTDLSLLEPDYLRFIPFLYLLAASQGFGSIPAVPSSRAHSSLFFTYVALSSSSTYQLKHLRTSSPRSCTMVLQLHFIIAPIDGSNYTCEFI